MSDLAIIFRLGESPCALPAEALHEILEDAHVSPAPMAPASIEGVLNRLGQLYVVFDLGSLVGLSLHRPEKVMLFGHANYSFAAWVDEVLGVASISADRLETESTLPFQVATLRYRDSIVPLLNPDAVFRRVDELI